MNTGAVTTLVQARGTSALPPGFVFLGGP